MGEQRKGTFAYSFRIEHLKAVLLVAFITLTLLAPSTSLALPTPTVLGTINVKTQVYEGQVLLIGPPGVKLVHMEKNPIIEKALSTPLSKNILIERPPITSLQFTVEAQGPTMEDVIKTVGADQVKYKGDNVIVGVIDTGVDFLSKGLGLEKIAFDENGYPMLFDADEFGLVITPLNVTYRNPYTKMLATEGEYVEIFIPTYGKARIYVDFDWAAPQIESKSGFYKFGFMVAFIFPGNYLLGGSLPGIGYLIPAVMVDSEEEGVYDTVFLDMSTAWFTIGGIFYAFGAIIEPPPIEMLDFSFRDERPLRMGEGVAGLDFDGDGVYDYSLGVISGYVYDAFGVINNTVEIKGMTWETAWEPLATGVYPGIDPEGKYFSLFYDPLGHGTSVANIIAGKQTKYFIPTEQGLSIIESRGIAPGTKIAAAMALFTGNVLAALYWLSGHDYVNGTWVYSGAHKADIISNSWGILYWPATLLADGPGFPPGSDPLSLHLENITKKTIVVFAAGNEGPGKASIAMGGASEHVITVGASTVFGKAIYDAFGHLLVPEGVNNGIISWSSRGPNGVLKAKPDVVAPGAYALVPTAVINGLGDGTQAIDIFGGTSMAAPVVSGVLAIMVDMLKQNGVRTISTQEANAILKMSVSDLGYPSDMQGAGLINASLLLDKAVTLIDKRTDYEIVNTIIDSEKGTVVIEIEGPIDEKSRPLLQIQGEETLIYSIDVSLEQYEQQFLDIPLASGEGPGIYKITVTSKRNVTEEQLPYTIVWLGGWNHNKTDVESQIEKIVLIDHALLSGKQVTLYASTKLIGLLDSKGLLYNQSMLRLMLFSILEGEEQLAIKVHFAPLKQYEGIIKGNTIIFENVRELELTGKQATLITEDRRIPISLSKTLKLSDKKTEVNISVKSSTHSAYLTGLGDLYIIPISIETKSTVNDIGESVIGYVFNVEKGRADLYLIGPEKTGENQILTTIKSYYATHPPGYTVSKEAFYPYPKSTAGTLIVAVDTVSDGAKLLVYVLDSEDNEVRITITPIIFMKTIQGGKTYVAISSEQTLGPILLEPSKTVIYHESGMKTALVHSQEGVSQLVLLGEYQKTLESYVDSIGILTKSFEPEGHVIIKVSDVETRFAPA